MDPGRSERRLAAIMFTDVVGYTALMARDEEAGRCEARRHEGIVRPLVERYAGRLIEVLADESLSCFSSSIDAVNCALALQAELDGDDELQLRIGIHLGQVLFEGKHVIGDGVHIAARVTVQAQPGGVAISKQVHDSVQGQTHLEFGPPRKIDFRLWPFTVYSVHGDPELPGN